MGPLSAKREVRTTNHALQELVGDTGPIHTGKVHVTTPARPAAHVQETGEGPLGLEQVTTREGLVEDKGTDLTGMTHITTSTPTTHVQETDGGQTGTTQVTTREEELTETRRSLTGTLLGAAAPTHAVRATMDKTGERPLGLEQVTTREGLVEDTGINLTGTTHVVGIEI